MTMESTGRNSYAQPGPCKSSVTHWIL